MMRSGPIIVSVVLVGSLSACASGGFSASQGGISDAESTFASDHSLNFSCSRYDAATGNITDQVTIQRALNPNAASVAALAAGFQAVLGLAGSLVKVAPVPGVMAARPSAPPPPPLTVAGCIGEHGLNYPMPNLPNPVPPQQGSAQQPSARETGQNPRPYAPAAYAAPSLDRSGVAHAAEDDPDAALQQRLADASSRTEYAR